MTLRDVTGVLQATVKKGNLPDPEFEDAIKALNRVICANHRDCERR